MKKPPKLKTKAQTAIDLGRYVSAIEILNPLIDAAPTDVSYLMMRGEALLRNENYEDALTDYAKVVELENNNISALNNFGVALLRCNRYKEAKSILEYVIELEPNNFDAHINLCTVLQSLQQPAENLKVAFKAIELNPKSAMAYNNMGSALGDLQLIEESRQAYLTSVALDPKNIPAIINLAQIQEKLENRREAIELYENALKLKNISPGHSELVKYYLSYSYLFFGELDKGWGNYDYGFGALLPVGAARSLRKFTQPRWRGESIQGKRLLIWREQGLGDEIMFASCFPDLLELGVEVVVECESRLINIFQRAYPSFEVRLEHVNTDRYSAINDFDYHCPMGSLPGIFRNNIQNFYKPAKPLPVDTATYEHFRSELEPFRQNGKILVGICWRSGLLSAARNLHYTALTDWQELLTQPDFQFVNLQYGECEEELKAIESAFGISIIRWDGLNLKQDVDKVFSLIQALDGVVTTGTAVCQMAGALNKKTYLLTRRGWTLLGEKDKFPWFSSVTPLVAEKGMHLAENIKYVPAMLRDYFNAP